MYDKSIFRCTNTKPIFTFDVEMGFSFCVMKVNI